MLSTNYQLVLLLWSKVRLNDYHLYGLGGHLFCSDATTLPFLFCIGAPLL